MESKILQANGQPMEKVPSVKWGEHLFPIRSLNEEIIKSADPKALIAAVCVQINDHTNLLWAGLYALAKDVYSKNTGTTPSEFMSFVEAIGLRIDVGNRTMLNVAEELKKVSNI